MNEDEQKVLAHLVEAWNAFIKLPSAHPDEQAEFRSHFHDLQRMILTRPYLRGEEK